MVHKSVFIPVDHPAFVGHFPGNPILPGVAILDIVVTAYGSEVYGISFAKFLSIVAPGDTLSVHISNHENGRVKFAVKRENDLICEGQLITDAGHV
ncbi:MAG: 3-hydroxylacyl-ACP dehydratase [Fluviibacter sp.]